jgi:hypothetical protein
MPVPDDLVHDLIATQSAIELQLLHSLHDMREALSVALEQLRLGERHALTLSESVKNLREELRAAKGHP